MMAGGALQVFYGFGLAGLAWSFWWEAVVKGIQEDEPEAYLQLTRTSRQVPYMLEPYPCLAQSV